MGVLYFGDPQGALHLLKANVKLVGLVHGRIGGPGWQRLHAALRRRAPIPRWQRPDLSDDGVIEGLRALEPTLIVSCFYPDLIPVSLLDVAPGINVHPSDLPQWRGPDPVIHTILSGQSSTAICVHVLAEGLDTGAIYRRESVELKGNEEAGALSSRLEKRGAELISTFVVDWLEHGPSEPSPQSGDVSWAPQRDDDWWEVDWHRSAVDIERFVRAAYPHPGAYTGIGDELLVIQKCTAAVEGAFSSVRAGTPFIRGGEFFIRCGVGALQIHRLKLGRRTMSGIEFARLLC